MKGRIFAALAISVAAFVAAPAWSDDWDGLGFLASIGKFDLDHFAPHPPGYPVYVAFLKLAAKLVSSPMLSAAIVSALSAGASFALFADAADRAFGKSRGALVAFAAVTSPLAFRAESGVGSEALALCFAAASAWGLAAKRPMVTGLAAGLGLGVRLSWAPLYLPLLVLSRRGERLRVGACAVAGLLAWAIPFVARVGPAHLVALLSTHFGGHAARWGGTALTDPGIMRLVLFARDVFVDGLGGGDDPLGLAILGVCAGVAFVGLGEWRRIGWEGAGKAALALAPYALWILVGQNLRQQPRHALPLVVALSGALALAATSVDRVRRLGVALFFLICLRSYSDAHTRATTPPPGAQLVQAVRDTAHPPRVAVFGGPSVRFFEPTDLAASAQSAHSLADVRLALGRMQTLPAKVLVTDELDGFGSPPYPTAPFGTYCRPERIDRRAPCLRVVELKAPFLPTD